MGGFIKGIFVGLVSFGAGFALLGVILPPPDEARRAPQPLDDRVVELTPEPEDGPDAEAEATDDAQPESEPAAEPMPAIDTPATPEAPLAAAEAGETGPAGPASAEEAADMTEIAEEPAPHSADEDSATAEAADDITAPDPGMAESLETTDDSAEPEVSENASATAPPAEDATHEEAAREEAMAPPAAEDHPLGNGDEIAAEAAPHASPMPAPEATEPEITEPEAAETEAAATEDHAGTGSETTPATDAEPTADISTDMAAETPPRFTPEAAPLPEADTGPGDDEAPAPASETTADEAEATITEMPAQAMEPATAEPAPVLRAVPPAPPQPGLNRVVEGVTLGRLPAIGAESDPAEAEEDPAAETPGIDADAALPAYRRFAARHEAPTETGTETRNETAADPSAGLPLFGIILIDAPADAAAETAILALPFPVSVALDPEDGDAARRATAYRQAGHEVLILADGLPRAAQPSDIEVTLEGWLRALPEAIGLLDPPTGPIQGDRLLAQRLAPALAGRGLALVMPERGLNAAQQSARSAGLAHATVFRVLDAEAENAFTIRRYLDRATFRAQQEGQVLVLGHAARADTLDGLIGWRMEGRAGQVSLAPASATLQEP